MTSVVLDALFLDPGVSGGPETYLRSLVPAMAAARPDLRLTVISSRRGTRSLREAGWGDFAVLEALPSDDDQRVRKLVTQQLLLPRRVRALDADIVHSCSNLAPLRAGAPLVLTLFDIIYLQHASMRRLSRLSIGAVVRLAAPRAAAVITLSDAARVDIVATLGLPGERVYVIAPGAGRPPSVATPAKQTTASLAIPPGRLVLCVAAKREHKNQELLVRALPLLPEDIVVVCVGRDDGYEPRLRVLAEEMGVSARLVLLGYVRDADLEGLWAIASVAALPTREEGFGLPVLEAMLRGVPVACSDIAVLREVGGPAAHFFDPDDPASAAAAIERALGDREAAVRGRERAAAFSWEAAGRATAAVYDHVLQGSVMR